MARSLFRSSKPRAKRYKGHWFWKPFRAQRSFYIHAAFAGFFTNAFAVVSPLFIMNVYDRVLPHQAIDTGWVLGIGALTIFLFDLALRSLRTQFIDMASYHIDNASSHNIYTHLLSLRLAEKPRSSGSMASMLREFDMVRDFMTSASLTILIDLPFTFIFLAIIWFIGPLLAMALAALMMIAIFNGLIGQWRLRNLIKNAMVSADARHGILVETITGLETIKALGAQEKLADKYQTLLRGHADLNRRIKGMNARTTHITAWLQQSSSVILVLIGMYMVQAQTLSIGGMIAAVILAGRALAPLGQIAGMMTRMYSAREALRNLNAFMKTDTDIAGDQGAVSRPELQGAVTFDSVSFRYPQVDKPILTNVSFSLKPGEKVGIIGRVGSGKSTIARLLLNLYSPTDGHVMLDGTDHRQINPQDLRQQIGYIAQDVALINGSVRENILLGHPDATDDNLQAVIQDSGVHHMTARHPLGLDAPVGEGGCYLSGGQRQAIALARALIGSPKLFVCDEPTNAMDVQSEAAFHHVITNAAKDSTLVLITHRQPLLSLVDRLILIDKGRVILDGPRDKVIEAVSAGKVRVPT